jgi:hypothetical protein
LPGEEPAHGGGCGSRSPPGEGEVVARIAHRVTCGSRPLLSTLSFAEVVAPVTVVRARFIVHALDRLCFLASSTDGLVFLLRSRAESDLATTSFQVVVPAELTG